MHVEEGIVGLLPIMEKGKPQACHADWPIFYMNDFSRLGLLVSRLEETLAVLESSGYRVREDDRGAMLEIDSREQMAGVFDLLSSRMVEYEMADLVGCVYQG
jgi:hypothetical protein